MSYELRVEKRQGGKGRKPVTRRLLLVTAFLLFTVHCSLFTAVHAEVLERIVAIVNDQVILLSEYDEAVQAAKNISDKVNEDVVLNDMINKILLLDQAKKLKLDSVEDSTVKTDEGKLINEYIERRIKPFIHIPVDEIESYYTNNKDRFSGRMFYEAKDEIEDYLAERELKTKVAGHIAELRKKAYIKIQK